MQGDETFVTHVDVPARVTVVHDRQENWKNVRDDADLMQMFGIVLPERLEIIRMQMFVVDRIDQLCTGTTRVDDDDEREERKNGVT